MTFNGVEIKNYNNLQAPPDLRYKVDFPGGPGLWLKQTDCVHYGAQIGDLIVRICDEYEAASIAAAVAEADGVPMEGEEHAVTAIVSAKFRAGELYLGVLWDNADRATYEKAVNCADADVTFNAFIAKLCDSQ